MVYQLHRYFRLVGLLVAHSGASKGGLNLTILTEAVMARAGRRRHDPESVLLAHHSDQHFQLGAMANNEILQQVF